jgi:hypothetical protein
MKVLWHALRRLAWWRKKDPLIVSLRMLDHNDNSPATMVSEEWIKRQDRINDAAQEVIRLSREFAEAQERLGDAMRSEEGRGQ